MTAHLKQCLSDKGWEMKPPGFIRFNLEKLTAEFERAYAKGATESGYENVASLSVQDIAELPAVAAMFEDVRKHMQAISPALRFEELWLVSTKEANVHPDVVPFVPHIDKHRYLKAMVYLDDVGEHDGPFTVASCPPTQNDALRKTFGPDYKERRQNVIEMLPRTAFRPCTGQAGSIIFFDTNCPHFAGHVQGGGMRRVFRFDFTEPAWNPVSARSRLVGSLRKAISMFGGTARH